MDQAAHNKIPLLVVCGPTASGKTRLAIDLAKQFGGEVVSADSMQIYRGMDIGTAKPTTEEMGGIPHHLLDIAAPDENFSLVDYLAKAREAVQDIHSRGKLPVMAGGTGLYITSFVENLQFEEIEADPTLRQELEALLAEKGPQHLWVKLQICDPELAASLHPNNTGRVIRALEVHALTGTPMSKLQQQSRQTPSPYRPCMLGLCFRERETLYERINLRVDLMMKAGLLDEVQAIREETLSKTAAQAIGYKELFSFLDGNGSLEEAVELIKRQSRRYAKRQMTWLRRESSIQWLEWESYPDYQHLLNHASGLCRQFLTEGGNRK